MNEFVLDNSVAMRWCFDGTSSPYAERVLDKLLLGDQAVVPPIWLYEVVSVLAKSVRSGALDIPKAGGFLEDLQSLDFIVDDQSTPQIFGDVHRLAINCRLSGYDAAYLELAIRKHLPLATLDDDLIRASAAAGVERFAA